jgi:hypothetical protein
VFYNDHRDNTVLDRVEEKAVQFWTGWRRRQCSGKGGSPVLSRMKEETAVLDRMAEGTLQLSTGWRRR